jgi:hypothetical protein
VGKAIYVMFAKQLAALAWRSEFSAPARADCFSAQQRRASVGQVAGKTIRGRESIAIAIIDKASRRRN